MELNATLYLVGRFASASLPRRRPCASLQTTEFRMNVVARLFLSFLLSATVSNSGRVTLPSERRHSNSSALRRRSYDVQTETRFAIRIVSAGTFEYNVYGNLPYTIYHKVMYNNSARVAPVWTTYGRVVILLSQSIKPVSSLLLAAITLAVVKKQNVEKLVYRSSCNNNRHR